jgi:hypothetical protein
VPEDGIGYLVLLGVICVLGLPVVLLVEKILGRRSAQLEEAIWTVVGMTVVVLFLVAVAHSGGDVPVDDGR